MALAFTHEDFIVCNLFCNVRFLELIKVAVENES